MPAFASVGERLSIPISAGFDIFLEIASVLRDVSRLHVRLQAVLNTCILILEKEQQLVWICTDGACYFPVIPFWFSVRNVLKRARRFLRVRYYEEKPDRAINCLPPLCRRAPRCGTLPRTCSAGPAGTSKASSTSTPSWRPYCPALTLPIPSLARYAQTIVSLDSQAVVTHTECTTSTAREEKWAAQNWKLLQLFHYIARFGHEIVSVFSPKKVPIHVHFVYGKKSKRLLDRPTSIPTTATFPTGPQVSAPTRRPSDTSGQIFSSSNAMFPPSLVAPNHESAHQRAHQVSLAVATMKPEPYRSGDNVRPLHLSSNSHQASPRRVCKMNMSRYCYSWYTTLPHDVGPC
jgi:hypothetical protein